MAHLVGTKGQVVIAKDIRDRLGVKAGWLALQRLVEDHIEVYFVPPEHRESLKGSLRKHLNVSVDSGADWRKARDASWSVAALEKMGAKQRVS